VFTNGSASFAEDVSIGGQLYSADGIKLDSRGILQSSRSGTNPIFQGFTTGSGVATSQIFADGSATFTGNVNLLDNDKLLLGTGNDLQIYHSGSHSFITDSGTGNLYLNSNRVVITNAADSETLANFIENGAVELFYDASRKLATTSGGVDITGDLTANSGSNQVKIGAGDGAIELTRSAGGAYIDFKNSTSEDYDARISENNGGLATSGALTVGGKVTATGFDLSSLASLP
jgi:hypothetical protein